ncbi:hypothetical protein V5799_030719 [Amblyomma americanum]|uniref:Uncharacterized protein n=1 Tax=Amblyomma americanum TaxID=6943 RepID=A0AAQ4EMI9_AMBAM
MDYTDGGSSPWFNKKGRLILSGLTTEPEDAGLFTEHARDGSMGALVSFLDTAQPSVSTAAFVCYILLGLVLLQLFVGLPVAAFGFRRYAAKVGLIPWLCCEVVLLACAAIQLICLLSMISTWYGMNDGLEKKTPQAYDWTFELLRNYTKLTIHQLKKGTSPAVHKKLDLDEATTINSIKWMQGNLSAWENNYSGHAALKNMLTGPLPILQMGVLALAVAAATASVLLGFATWNRRQQALKKGRHAPLSTPLVVMVFDTDMTSACPLLTDELIGHWMALVLSAVFGMLGGLAAVAIAVIFLAIGKKKKKKRIVRKRRIKKKPKEKPTPPPTPPPPPPPPLPPPPVPSVVNIEVEVPTPVPVIIPQRRRRPRHHHCRPEPPIILVSSPPCSHPTPALMAAPLAFPPAVMPSMAMPVGAVSRVVASPIATSPAVSPALMTSPLPFASTVMPSMGVPVGAVSQVAAASVPTSPTISTVMMPRSPGCCGCDESSSRENFLGHTNANFCDSGVALAHVPNRSMVLAAQQPAYSRVLSPLRRAASLCTLRRSSVVHRSGNMPPATMAVLPGRPLVRRVPGAVQPLVSRRVTYAVPRRI